MKPNLPASTSTGPRAGPMARAPWLVAAAAAVAVSAGFLMFNQWATTHAPSWSLSQPLVALPSLLLLVLALSIRAWPTQKRQAPKAEPQSGAEPEARPRRPAPNWSDVVRHASRALHERGFGQADGIASWQAGADLVLNHGQRSFVIHARHWRERLVEGDAVRSLAHEIAQRGAVSGMLLCASGLFSGQARQLAKLHGIVLMDRTELNGEPRAAASERTELAAPTARVPEPGAAAPPPNAVIPVLRPDQAVKVARREFAPTVPMSDAERRRMRVSLRPDHTVKVPRDFEPTQPLNDDR